MATQPTTLAEAYAQKAANAFYRANNSSAQAQDYILACDFLLDQRPRQIGINQRSHQFETAQLIADKADAASFLARIGTGSNRAPFTRAQMKVV